jgi:hypothetical protein
MGAVLLMLTFASCAGWWVYDTVIQITWEGVLSSRGAASSSYSSW